MADSKGGNSISEQATQISEEVIQTITDHSQGRHKGDKSQLEATLKRLLKGHFDKLGKADDPRRNQLRKRLALSLHSDKLRSNEVVYAYLESIDAKEVPFDCLQNYHTGPGMIREIALSPTAWFQRVFNHLVRIYQYKTELSEAKLAEKRREIARNHQDFVRLIPHQLENLASHYRVQYQPKTQDPPKTQDLQGIAEAISAKHLTNEDKQTLVQIQTVLARPAKELIDAQIEGLRSGLQFQLDSERAELNHIAPGLLFVLSMGDDLDRYFQPLRFLGNLIMWTLNFALIVFILISFLPGMVLGALRFILGFAVNLLTFGTYNARVDAYQASQVPKTFSTVMDAVRQQNPQLTEANDDEVFEAYLQALSTLPAALGGDCRSKLEYERYLKSQVPVGPFAFLKCSFGAIWDSLTHMPKGAGWGFLWVLTWVPRLALGLVLGVVGTVLTLAKTIVDNVLILGGLLLAFTVRILTLLALNLPIYLLVDLPRWCVGSKPKPGSGRPGTEPQRVYNPRHTSEMQDLGIGGSTSAQDREQEQRGSYAHPLHSQGQQPHLSSGSNSTKLVSSGGGSNISLGATPVHDEID